MGAKGLHRPRAAASEARARWMPDQFGSRCIRATAINILDHQRAQGNRFLRRPERAPCFLAEATVPEVSRLPQPLHIIRMFRRPLVAPTIHSVGSTASGRARSQGRAPPCGRRSSSVARPINLQVHGHASHGRDKQRRCALHTPS